MNLNLAGKDSNKINSRLQKKKIKKQKKRALEMRVSAIGYKREMIKLEFFTRHGGKEQQKTESSA